MAVSNCLPFLYPRHSAGKVPNGRRRRSRSLVVSTSRSVTFALVITAVSRCFVLVVVLSIFAVTLPVFGNAPVQPPPHRMSCCKYTAGERGHCGGSEPVQSQDSHCCAACNAGLSLFLASASIHIFSPERGEKFLSEDTASASRSDRPPVPPPRI